MTNGQENDVDIGFKDLFENTSGAFQLYAEARRNKFFMAFDWTWATLKSDVEGDLLDLNVRVDQRLYDFRLGYEVFRRALGQSDPDDPWTLREKGTDIYFGARYFKTEPSLTLTLPVGDPVTLGSKDERWDPFFGFRSGREITKRWLFGVRGDIGGFGIGDAAQLTWQLSASFGLRVGKRIYFLLGYRALAYDTVTGEGDNRNGTDFLQHGPMIGGGFAF